MWLALLASMFVAILDGVGLTMFLPLLKATSESGPAEGADSSMGQLSFLLDWLSALGIPLTLTYILVVMLFFFLAKGVARFWSDFYRVILQQRFANLMRLGSMRLLTGYDYQAFSKADSGRIQNTMSGEIGRITNAYRNYFQMLQSGIMTAVYVLLALAANPRFAMIVAAGGLVSNLLFSRIYRITKDASAAITRKMNVFQGFLIQSVTSYKFLKATNLIHDYKRKVDRSIIGIEKEQRRVGTMAAIANAIREPIIMGIVVSAILTQINVFEESLGLIILSLLFFYRGLTALVQMQNFYNNFLAVVGSIDNMESFVATMGEHQETTGGIALTGEDFSVELVDLSYAYTDRVVLDGLSLSVAPNTTIGIVGESGTGKTTLVNLLCGLLKPSPGMLFVNGMDSTELDLLSLRSRVGYVTQEAQIFTDTIYNNVSFWAPDTAENRQKVWDALKLAYAADFITELPEGLNTSIGINGINLSGGQRQRISIARELYRNVEFLILDEATSALDSQSEHYIQENIDALSGSYTMFIIAHRLSTIKKADKILYLKRNGEYEIGTFAELQARSQNFRSMVALQSFG